MDTVTRLAGSAASQGVDAPILRGMGYTGEPDWFCDTAGSGGWVRGTRWWRTVATDIDYVESV